MPSSLDQDGDGFLVAAPSFAEEALAVAAYFARVVHGYDVGSVVSDDVVDAVAEVFNPARFRQLAGFFKHQVARARHF